MHPYHGLHAALATRHGKERAIAPPLAALGLGLSLAESVDTDRFGTFSGEVPRAGTMRDAAIAKARAALTMAGTRLGIASEGSFGPHPDIPFIAAGREMIVLVDDRDGLVIGEAAISGHTNFSHCAVEPGSDIGDFLKRSGFPDHALIVRPHQGDAPAAKGIASRAALDAAVAIMAAQSADGLARIETDMRAHVNPTRMREIARLAQRFAARLATLCPSCGTPGFAIVRSEPGLPCSDCGAPTALVQALVSACPACSHQTAGPRSDGRSHASPAECPECNP